MDPTRPRQIALLDRYLWLSCHRIPYVRVYEKARGAGDRMATRHEGELRFDHGAQYFTVRDDLFLRYLEPWQEEGLVEKWKGTIASISRPGDVKIKSPAVHRYVGVPGMNAIARHLAEAVRPVYRTQIQSEK